MPVAVYQMGRVGSSTVFDTLRSRGIQAEHVHYAFSPFGEFTLAKHYEVGKQFLNDVQEWRIISIARDPMARNLSAFMFGLNNSAYPFKHYNPDRLLNLFVHNYQHNWCFDWFSAEMGHLVDVYAHPFDYVNGYVRILSEQEGGTHKRDIVIIRTEMFGSYSWLWDKFLGQPLMQLDEVTNSISGKFWYYNEFKQYVRGKLPETLVSRYYFEEDYTRHFYSFHERQLLAEYWRNPSAPMVEW